MGRLGGGGISAYLGRSRRHAPAGKLAGALTLAIELVIVEKSAEVIVVGITSRGVGIDSFKLGDPWKLHPTKDRISNEEPNSTPSIPAKADKLRAGEPSD